MKRSDIPASSPLAPFQSTVYEKEDFRKLVNGINKALSPNEMQNEGRLNVIFDKFWEDLQEVLDVIPQVEGVETEDVIDTAAILEELLQLARSQQRLLHSPEYLLPESYLRRATTVNRVRRVLKESEYESAAKNRKLRQCFKVMEKVIHDLKEEIEAELVENEQVVLRLDVLGDFLKAT